MLTYFPICILEKQSGLVANHIKLIPTGSETTSSEKSEENQVEPTLVADEGTSTSRPSFLVNGVNINDRDIASLEPDALMNDNIVTVLLW